MISIAYWLVLYPPDPVIDYKGKAEALHHFVLISITVVNSMIAIMEIMVLSSVRKQKVLSLSRGKIVCLKVLGFGYPGRWSHRYLPLIRDVDGLWPFDHRRICVQVL